MKTVLAAGLLAAVGCAQDAIMPPWKSLGLDRSIDWIADPETFVDARRVKRALTEEVDRDALLSSAIARAKDEGKPVMWYVYRIVEKSSRGRQMYRAPVLDVYTQQVLFNDPDVAAIVGEHFVPLRMVLDEAHAERYGLRPLDVVEPAVVFLDGDGEIVHFVERIRTFNALWLARLLGRVLDAAGIDVPAGAAASAGQYERALAHADDPYERATLLRRLARPDDALALLDTIDPPTSEVLTERGLVLTLAGRTEEALATLRDAAGTAGTRQAEARYLLAINTMHTGDHEHARAVFARLAHDAPDSPWGRRARANTELGNDRRPLGAAFCGFESFRYLDEDAYRGLPRDTTWAGDPQSREQLVRTAVEFLLDQQRADGGFTDSRYAYWPSPEITPNAWIAITALAASALLAHREVAPARIEEALRRAERYAFDPANLARGKNEDVYADAYRLFFLAERHRVAETDERARLVKRMSELIAEAATRQRDTGFFAHEYPNAFCTGAMLWSVHRAREAGAEVPLSLVSTGVHALLSARRDDGGFVYGGAAGKRQFRLADSSGRMPLCESTLFAFGASDPEKVRFAYETFWKYMDKLEQVRRNDFHSDGELAGFFFFHSLFHAAECKHLLLDDELRLETGRRLLGILQRIPEIDGSFVDSHEIGRSYGTAMALLTIARL